jgi:hypothetical protein
MFYYRQNIRSFLSSGAAGASLVALLLWVILDVIFIRTIGVCGLREPKAAPAYLECHILGYHYNSALWKWFDDFYSWKAFLRRAFAVYDEARHNMDHICGKTFGAKIANAAWCRKNPVALEYAQVAGLLLFYIWGPLWMVWQVLKRMFVKKPQVYAGNY